MSIQELKETWLRRIKNLDEEIGKTDSDTEREKMVRLVAKRSVYQYELGSLESLQSEHKAEIEALERKAWECSVEMMETGRAHAPSSDASAWHRGVFAGFKCAAYELREAFGFPKSETPEKVKK